MGTSQDEVLRVLLTKEVPVAAEDITTELACPKATVTSLLNKMKTKRWVDGGGKEWVVTDAGRKKVDSGTVIPLC